MENTEEIYTDFARVYDELMDNTPYELGLTDHDILRIGPAFYALYGQQAGWWQCHEFWQE